MNSSHSCSIAIQSPNSKNSGSLPSNFSLPFNVREDGRLFSVAEAQRMRKRREVHEEDLEGFLYERVCMFMFVFCNKLHYNQRMK